MNFKRMKVRRDAKCFDVTKIILDTNLDAQYSQVMTAPHFKSEILSTIFLIVRVANFDEWCGERPRIESGGLERPYYLNNIHFHWSQDSNIGSEHSVDGRRYSAEVL